MVLVPVGRFGCFKGIRVVEEPIGDMAMNRSFFVDIPIHEGRDSSVKTLRKQSFLQPGIMCFYLPLKVNLKQEKEYDTPVYFLVVAPFLSEQLCNSCAVFVNRTELFFGFGRLSCSTLP